MKGVVARFDLWHESTQETVLHVALKKEHVRALVGGVGTPDQMKDYEKRSVRDKRPRQVNPNTNVSFCRRYSDCLDILLSRDSEAYNKQIRLIINKLDDRGNTPLHYATSSGKASETSGTSRPRI